MDDASVKIIKFGNRNEAEYGPIKNQKSTVNKIKENYSIDKNIHYIVAKNYNLKRSNIAESLYCIIIKNYIKVINILLDKLKRVYKKLF